MTRILLVLLALMGTCLPAMAHKLKVFAAAEGRTVRGYAFFVGGTRPRGVAWTATDATGGRLADGRTDDEGRFSFDIPADDLSDVTIAVDTGDAHVASVVLPAGRLGPAPAHPASSAAAAAAGAVAAPQASPEEIASMVETAIQRQIEPLLERIEQMDSRLRFTDVLSGILFIVGLAGIGLWARARRS
ncbi:cobalamin biosynthesis protein CbiL [Enterovirga sp. CN4-39]|uniref:cobalamin biosynthesis protein CbiL n=1 Tax=Enterovirga sp. CN4-39 TaxID=3400910 RepID=UPI003C05937F